MNDDTLHNMLVDSDTTDWHVMLHRYMFLAAHLAELVGVEESLAGGLVLDPGAALVAPWGHGELGDGGGGELGGRGLGGCGEYHVDLHATMQD